MGGTFTWHLRVEQCCSWQQWSYFGGIQINFTVCLWMSEVVLHEIRLSFLPKMHLFFRWLIAGYQIIHIWLQSYKHFTKDILFCTIRNVTVLYNQPTYWWNEMLFCPGSNSFFGIQRFLRPNAAQETTIIKSSCKLLDQHFIELYCDWCRNTPLAYWPPCSSQVYNDLAECVKTVD